MVTVGSRNTTSAKTNVPSLEKGDPWFDDGNIVLLTEESKVAFKVHRGVLARHSEVFESMFAIPQPDADLELYEGCQVVHMYDIPTELSDLVVALYDGVVFQTRNIVDFFYLAGILRLSTKYFISHLRTKAILHLTQTWCYALDAHDRMIQRALQSPITDDITFPYAHPLHVLNLAREVNVQIVIPSVLYYLTLYPLADILRGDHPKLLCEHPSRPSCQLSSIDLKDYTLMFQHRWDLMLRFVHEFFGERSADMTCLNGQASCTNGFARHANRLSRSWRSRTSPLHYMMQATQELVSDVNICFVCRKIFERDAIALRQKVWDELPTVIGLPTWEELKEMDLPV
ncbi:hypothetical protein SERLA73DRAFT_109815 [Serpula lacrymans var. lacrymans S7.3]|uniref:BTB domain-containing protein n=2 Tax=Serpula lacrymans var. lacrymans TaxID=341189 RepID=F8PZP5_SERL3|nr:uncharacterized protein SERLADRAFT_439235 [Serpula lacrymans var. lacrymans S7.9]EGN98367.1 hypothetical protein SERLA73DRAFT_109815 [Serpula lacrymans var. lacrymans S7.3]EGO23922.1 hypothetical protein SERLADRAFT_439235 [Serpula lacrymans var. lacrymans S7.9]